jgi:hypothetical protein
MFDTYTQHKQVSNTRDRFIDDRIGRLCDNGMDYWQAVKVAEKQADYCWKHKGFYPRTQNVN